MKKTVFPTLDSSFRAKRLEFPTSTVRMVLDTDTYNEIDDQFAVAYALLSKEKLRVEALYAAPFLNDRSVDPADGMEKSYEEILRLLERMNISAEGFVYRGSTDYLRETPQSSPAALDLVKRAMASSENDPLYVVAIGAITNVASAMLLEPEIIRKIVVVWLGGHLHSHPNTNEFNLQQDVASSRLMFDSGVPFVQIPCLGAASHLLTTKAELKESIAGRNRLCDFLYERFCGYNDDHFAWGKEIWDISAIAWLLNQDWLLSRSVPAPRLTGEWDKDKGGHLSFEADQSRHQMREVWMLWRNPIFRDLFEKLRAA